MQGKGLYIFDEPEAALSPVSQLALMILINDIIATGQAQIIIATHSPLLMAMPNAQFLYFKEGEMLERNYKTTDHYRIYSRFFAAPDQYIAAHLA
jgi:predicted ATPase